MRRRILKSLGALLVLAMFYESAFRLVTANCGAVDNTSRPPRVYYRDDLTSPFPWRSLCFDLRAKLPLGKVRLSKGSGYYVNGGRFYRRGPDGRWDDATDSINPNAR